MFARGVGGPTWFQRERGVSEYFALCASARLSGASATTVARWHNASPRRRTALRAAKRRNLGRSSAAQLSFVPIRSLVVNAYFRFEISFRKATGEFMTARIGKDTIGNTVIRLIGRIQSEDLEGLLEAMKETGPRTVLDVSEVTIVDIDVVRFLKDREVEGIVLLHCSRYIREWINREAGHSERVEG